jgi:DNA/RNA endonuclease YhcR with UshA esterase domain
MFKLFSIAVFIFIATVSSGQPKIPVDSAVRHIGETVTICSTVYGVKSMEKVTFMNLGSAYPHSPLTVVIFAKDRGNFSDAPEKLYGNKSICVTGAIKEYKGKAEIIVRKQEEIKVH